MPQPHAYPNDFPGIELHPGGLFTDVRRLYLHQEPQLLAAIRRGDRRAAVRILNLVLVHIYSAGEQHNEKLRGLLLELVVMMSRAAVESGASAESILGLGYRHLSELAAIEDDEALAAWLRGCFLRIFEEVERCGGRRPGGPVERALACLRARPAAPHTRESVAKEAGVSPAHLSELLKKETGRTFSEWLADIRIEAACESIACNPRLPLAEVAQSAGFCDQSHFTKVFQSRKGVTPLRYRREIARAAQA